MTISWRKSLLSVMCSHWNWNESVLFDHSCRSPTIKNGLADLANVDTWEWERSKKSTRSRNKPPIQRPAQAAVLLPGGIGENGRGWNGMTLFLALSVVRSQGFSSDGPPNVPYVPKRNSSWQVKAKSQHRNLVWSLSIGFGWFFCLHLD